MSQKQESLRADLRKILSRGGRPVINKSSDGKVVPVPEEAEVFEIEFTKDGESYGKVYVSIDGLHQLIVYFDEKVSNSPKNGSADSESWEQLVRTLKRFATMKQLSFKLTDLDNLENDMSKREHTKRQESVYEGYHAQGKKASYNDNIPECKMIIKHSRNIEEGEQRYRNIAQIFIENTLGERFLAPTTKPGLARVYARHIAEGGKANDDRWNHINGLCEEYSKMAGFVRATRNGQFNESAQQLVAEGINHYQKLRESLSRMSGKRGYNAYFESYTPSLMEDEEQVDLSEMFMSSSLDPRIEGVMPILSKLSKNITETSEMSETIALEAWADDIIGTHKGGTVSHKGGVTKHQSGPGVYGGYDASIDPDSPEEKHTDARGAKAGHRTDKIAVKKVSEVDAPKSGKPSNKEVAKKMHSILSKDKTTDEGWTGAALGGLAGAALTKSPSGAMSGASLGSQIQDKMMAEEPDTSRKPSRQEVAKKMHSILSKSVDKSNMARVKTQQDIGSRVSDIGAGGKEHNVKTDKAWDNQQGVAEGEVVPLGKKHSGDLGDIHSCPKCGGDLQGGNYQGHRVKVCQPCKQVYLPPNSGIDQQGNKTNEQGVAEELSMKHQRDHKTQKYADTSNSLANRSFRMAEVPNITTSADGHPTVKYRTDKAGATRVDPTITPTSVKRKDSDKPIPSFLQKQQGIAEVSTVNGRVQDPKDLVWKLSSMSQDEAAAKYGSENVRRGPKLRNGDSSTEVRVPLGEASGVKTGEKAPKGTSTMPKDKEKAKGKPVAEGQEDLNEGIMDSLNGIINKIKMTPGIQKFIGAAKAKQDQLIQALQHSANGKDLVANIQQAVGGQQAVAEGWGQKIGGAVAASAGGGLLAGAADIMMRAYIAMGKPDLTQMMNDPNGRNAVLLVGWLVVLGALAMLAGGSIVKKGMDKDAEQPMREGQEDLDRILTIMNHRR